MTEVKKVARGERIEREAENKAGKRNEKRKERRRSERCKDIEIEEGSERSRRLDFPRTGKIFARSSAP